MAGRGGRIAGACALALVAGVLSVVGVSGGASSAHVESAAHVETLPADFADTKAIGTITEPIAVAFAPAPDNAAFIALKTGLVKSFDYDSATGEFEPNAESTNFADLQLEVENYWDRGMTGIAVDPQFPTRPYVYVNYVLNMDPTDPSQTVPKWHAPGHPNDPYDECPSPASSAPPYSSGCVVTVRVSRLTAQKGPDGWEMKPGSEKPLVTSGCFQFGSHTSGDLAFGPDGKLYASMGDGASFDSEDYGQYLNPCGDPADEGGSLRAQDARTAGDPLGLNGSVFRLDPDTGNPVQLAYGHRNPWRLTFRPGTTELWNGDVGASAWEEVNRLPNATTATTAVNRGWPCYEGGPSGSMRNNAWDLLDKPICENLYAEGTGAVQAPYFSYQTRLNAGPLTPGEDCEYSTSSISGLAFVPTTSSYPASMKGSLFFSDYARQCIWRLGQKADGTPDPSSVTVFAQRAGTPVDLTAGPGGDLYYVDYGLDAEGNVTENAGGIHRFVYHSPVARISADKTTGDIPLTVKLDGRTSSDPSGRTLTYAWDLDNDGQYDDSTSATPTKVFSTRGVFPVRLRVSNGAGGTGTASLDITAGRAPTITSVTPDASLTWQVGQRIAFSGAATDGLSGAAIPAKDVTWRLVIRHCPSGVCHSHTLQTFAGTLSGSFEAPDHEYPSHLLLSMTAKDAYGVSATRTVELDPKTVDLTFASDPGGLPVSVAGTDAVTRQTFIVGSTFTVSAAAAQQQGARRWRFRGWSDGGAATHAVVAPATAQTLVASYDAVTVPVSLKAKGGKFRLTLDGTTHRGGWVGALPVGTTVTVSAAKHEKKKGRRYVFKKWKDGGTRTRVVTVGEAPVELVAVYRRVRPPAPKRQR